MQAEINVWCGDKYGGTPIGRIRVEKDAVHVYGEAGVREISFYFNDESGVIDFKNKVPAAFEKYRRTL